MKKIKIRNLITDFLNTLKLSRMICGMKNSFTVHEERSGLDVTLTLIYIIKEGSVTLNEASAKIAKKLYLLPFALLKKFHGNKVTFNEKVREMTMEEINQDQKYWNDHCDAVWSCYD